MMSGIHFEQHLRFATGRVEKNGHLMRTFERIDAKRKTRFLHEVEYAPVVGITHDGVGNADVVHAGIDKRLGFPHLRHRYTLRSTLELSTGERDRFVRFDMRSQRDVIRRSLLLHLQEVSGKAWCVDDETRARQIV